ncbi:MAG: flagellar basal body-associated protein FliL [Mariprofundaceae bacterium]
MADKEPDKVEEEKKSSGGLLQIIIIILLIAVLGLGGFIAWKLTNLEIPAAGTSQEEEKPLEEPAEKKPAILMDLDKVTVNLADEVERRYLQATITLAIVDEEGVAKVEEHKTQIRDLIITLLANKEFKEVRTSQGKHALKEELVYRINTIVGGEPVVSVYFSNFVAQ